MTKYKPERLGKTTGRGAPPDKKTTDGEIPPLQRQQPMQMLKARKIFSPLQGLVMGGDGFYIRVFTKASILEAEKSCA